MKCFALDSTGDVSVIDNQIQMISGNDLVKQSVITILGTNKNEWLFNSDEGITFGNILGKKKDDEIIKNEILKGLQQVDETFTIDEFSCDLDSETRKLTISFTAKNENGEIITGVNTWG